MTSWLKSSERTVAAVHLPLGRAGYVSTCHLQEDLHSLRCRGEVCDTVLSVEHEPVFTIGRSGSEKDIIVPQEVLQEAGITVHRADRGGEITYHGPGQLIIYPIVDLRNHGRDIKRYINNLEQAIINLLNGFAVKAYQRRGFPGVWVDSRKIAAVGVYIKHWVTRHGLALNINIDKAHFAMINPCGLDVETVSLADLVVHTPSMEDLVAALLAQLGSLFHWEIRTGEPVEDWDGRAA